MFQTKTPELKQIDQNILVLKEAKIPAVMVECGYITNKEDLAFIKEEQNQEKIARDILEGLVKFANTNLDASNQSTQAGAISNQQDSLQKTLSGYLLHHLQYPETNLNRNITSKIKTKITIDKDGNFAAIDFNEMMQGKQSPQEIVVCALAPKNTGNNSSKANNTKAFSADISIFENSIKNSLANFKYAGTLSEAKSIYIDIVYNIDQNNLIGVQSENISIERTSGPNSEPVTTSEPYTTNDTVPTNFEQTFTKVEIEAEYPGGEAGWIKYLNTNFKYPEEAIKKEIHGTVVSKFIIDTNGVISNIQIIKSANKILDDETINVIKNSGQWIPAIQNGRKVVSYKIQPLVYKLDK